MRIIQTIACAGAITAFTVCQTLAAQPNVVEVDSVDALHTLATLSSAFSVHLASYHCALTSGSCPADGGQGLLVWYNTGCDATNTDGGSTFYDGAGNCWKRANLNGDLRQWGVTAGSSYDASANPASVVGVTSIINTKVIPVMTAAGLHAIHTGQVSIKIDYDLVHNHTLTLPGGWSFTCDTPPVKSALKADYTKLPGSLIIAHTDDPANFIDAETNNNVEIHDCAVIIPEWYINPSLTSWPCRWPGGQTCGNAFTSPAQTYADLEAIRANMISAGDVAIKAGNGAYIHDITIAGFDNCIDIENAPHNLIKNVTNDCNIPIYEQGTNGQSTFKDIDNEPLLTKGTPADNEQIFRVTSIGPGALVNGHHLCRLTLVAVNGSLPITASGTEPDPRDDPYYFPAWVSGPDLNNNSCASAGTGRNGNDAGWALIPTMLGTNTYDLAGSQYSEFTPDLTNAVHTNADWSTATGNTAILRIAGPISNITPGMSVTSGDKENPAWPGCPSNCAVFTVQSVVQRATGPDPDDGYNGEIVLSQPIGQAFSAGGPIDVAFYSAHYQEPPDGSENRCHNAASGGVQAAGDCLILNAAVRYVAGYSDAGTKSSARLPASRGGHMAAGFLVDSVAGVRTINTQTYGHYFNIAVIDSGSCTFYQAAGDDNGELNAGNSVGFYLVGLSRGCLFVGKAPGKPGTAIVDDTFGVVDHSKAVSGQQVDVELGNSFTGTITLPTGYDTSDWPTHGEMHICANLVPGGGCSVAPPAPPGQPDDEIVAYTKVPGSNNAFSIIARARFSTTVVKWAGNAYLLWSEINNGSVRHEDKSASTIFSDLNENTTVNGANQFEILHGAATLDNIHTSGKGTGFVSTNTAGVTVTAANLADASLIFEDENAQTLTTVSPDSQFANYAPPGLTNLPLTLLNPGGGTLQANGFSALGTYGVGVLNLPFPQTTAGWPVNGVLLADNEEMAFALDADTTKIDVTARGVCGTAAASHGNGNIKFLTVELPCGSAGLKGYASNGFTIGSPNGGDEGAGTLNAKAIYRDGGPVGAASNWANGATATQAVGSTAFYPCQGYLAAGAITESAANSIVSVAGTLRNLQVQLSNAPGAGKSLTVTVRVNGTDTSLACAVSGSSNTTCTDNNASHAAAVTVGQTCSLRAVLDSGAAAAVRVHASTEFDN